MDPNGDWVAELACGHNQHVRHQPPFQNRPWVHVDSERTEKIGSSLECPLCERAELPTGLRLFRTSPEWTEETIPHGLRHLHRIAPGTWGRIVVRDGTLRFTMNSHPRLVAEVMSHAAQAIPPEIEHEVHPLGHVRFAIEFFSVDRTTARSQTSERLNVVSSELLDPSGDPACWAGLLCQECGAVISEGVHLPSCSAATP